MFQTWFCSEKGGCFVCLCNKTRQRIFCMLDPTSKSQEDEDTLGTSRKAWNYQSSADICNGFREERGFWHHSVKFNLTRNFSPSWHKPAWFSPDFVKTGGESCDLKKDFVYPWAGIPIDPWLLDFTLGWETKHNVCSEAHGDGHQNWNCSWFSFAGFFLPHHLP